MSHHCGCILPGDLHSAFHDGEPGGRVVCKGCGHEVRLWEHFESQGYGPPVCEESVGVVGEIGKDPGGTR